MHQRADANAHDAGVQAGNDENLVSVAAAAPTSRDLSLLVKDGLLAGIPVSVHMAPLAAAPSL